MSTRRRASMARASSPPEATLARGRTASPGLAPRRKVTSSPGSGSPTVTSRRAWGMASPLQALLDGTGQLGGRPAAGRPDLRLGRGQTLGLGGVEAAEKLAGTLLDRLELGRASRRTSSA